MFIETIIQHCRERVAKKLGPDWMDATALLDEIETERKQTKTLHAENRELAEYNLEKCKESAIWKDCVTSLVAIDLDWRKRVQKELDAWENIVATMTATNAAWIKEYDLLWSSKQKVLQELARAQVMIQDRDEDLAVAYEEVAALENERDEYLARLRANGVRS